MAHDVFLSHSSKDKTVADAVCARLEESELRCWIAPRDIRPGAEWSESIVKAIERSKVMVLIFSDHANQSTQIIREVERAVNKRIAIVPFRIEDVMPSKSLEYFISTPHWLDAMSPPLEKHIDYLISTVRAILDPTKSLPQSQQLVAPTPVPRPRQTFSVPLPHWARDRRVIGMIIMCALVVFYLLFRTPAPVESIFVGTWNTRMPLSGAQVTQSNQPDGTFVQSISLHENGTLFSKNTQYFMRTESGAERMISWKAQNAQTAEITSLVPNELWSQIAFASAPGSNVMQEISAHAGKTVWKLVRTESDGTQVWSYDPTFDGKQWRMSFEVGRDGTYRFAAELTLYGKIRARDQKYASMTDGGVTYTGDYDVIDDDTISVVTPTGPIVWKRTEQDGGMHASRTQRRGRN
ncbi:MAG: toll/interleukin-1 receptor domain-containing protein [Deltaproteobacteria bacterium]|nr:toll/interleukin-1 receptor domain-containing protein [Deltaproteobacteria bacterium]